MVYMNWDCVFEISAAMVENHTSARSLSIYFHFIFFLMGLWWLHIKKKERQREKKGICWKGKDNNCMVMTIHGTIPTMSNLDKPMRTCTELLILSLKQSDSWYNIFEGQRHMEKRREGGKNDQLQRGRLATKTIRFSPLDVAAKG